MSNFNDNVLFAYYEQELEEEYKKERGIDNDLRKVSESKSSITDNELKEKWQK